MVEKEKRKVSLTDLASDDARTGYADQSRMSDGLSGSLLDASAETNMEYEDSKNALRAAAGDDPRLQVMAELLIEWPGMRLTDLAKALGMSVKETRSLRGVLRSRYGKRD